MPYITQIDLQNRFGAEEVLQRNDPNNDGTLDADTLNAHISDVEAFINNMIEQIYTVPFANNNIPPVIKEITIDLVRERYFSDAFPPEIVIQKADSARKTLEKFAMGKLRLVGFEKSTAEQTTDNDMLLSKTATTPLRTAGVGFANLGNHNDGRQL